jgi:hypothetical protein
MPDLVRRQEFAGPSPVVILGFVGAGDSEPSQSVRVIEPLAAAPRP